MLFLAATVLFAKLKQLELQLSGSWNLICMYLSSWALYCGRELFSSWLKKPEEYRKQAADVILLQC
jgi:hypothetical protein